VRFPNVLVFPALAIVIKVIDEVLLIAESTPPPKRPRVEDEQEPASIKFVDKSPKSVAFPAVEKVTKAITLLRLGFPPAKIPLLEEEQLEFC
jgi:hypothetical protein